MRRAEVTGLCPPTRKLDGVHKSLFLWKIKMTTENQLRVWHIPQVPMDAFHVNVSSTQEAKKILDVLASYDIFQYENNIKPDYCNAGGLEIFEFGDWCEWSDEKTGESIDQIDLIG